MSRTLVLTLVAVLFAAPLAAEQEAAPLVEPGARIRLTSCLGAVVSTCRMAGTLSSWNRDSVLMRPEGREGTVGMPAAWVTRIEVSRGRGNLAGVGAAIGFVPGLLLLAAAVVPAPGDFDPPLAPGACNKTCAATTSVGLSVLGAAIGAFIGSAVRTERWETLPLPSPR